MALTISRTNAGQSFGGAGSTYTRYLIESSPANAVHTIEDLANTIGTADGWTVTKEESGAFRTQWNISYDSDGADNNRLKILMVAANITDNSLGQKVFRFLAPTVNLTNNKTYFQLMGSDDPTGGVGTHAVVNIGLERDGTRVGWFDVIYEDSLQISSVLDWRAWDQGVGNANGIADNARQVAFAGYPAGGSMNTPIVGGPYYTITFTDSDQATRRSDVDFLDGGMSGQLSMAVYMNNVQGLSNANPHVAASRYTLTSGTSMMAPNAPPEVNLYADSDNTYTPQGAFVNQYPQSYISNLSAADSDQENILRSRGPVQDAFGTAVTPNLGLVIKDYPFDTYRAITLGTNNSSANLTSQSPTTFLDPQPIRGSKFDQGRNDPLFHGARGNLFASSGYTVNFNQPNGTAHTHHGFVIRQRNATSIVPTATASNTSYNLGSKDVFNNELEYYAWEIDSETGAGTKSGYSLDWYLRPNTTSTGTNANLGPPDKVLYTGTYNVWHGIPGSNTANMLVKTPYNADSPPDRAVTDTIVLPQVSQYSDADVRSMGWTANAVSGAMLSFDDNFDTLTLDSDTTTNRLFSTLSDGVRQVVSHWSSLTQAQKITPGHQYTGASGIFDDLIDHECVLASVSGTTLDISDKNSSSFVAHVITTSGAVHRTITGTDAIQTLRMSHGVFDLDGITLDCRSAHGNQAFLDGNCRDLYRDDSENNTVYAMDGNTQMNGDYTLSDSRSDLINPTAIFYRFRDCAIASGGSLSFTRDGSNSRPVYVIGAPAGATYNTGVTPVQQLVITRDAVTGETSPVGRLSIHSSNGDFLTENVTGVLSGSTVTYTVDSVGVSGLTGNVIVVWTDGSSMPARVAVDVGNSGGTFTTHITPVAVTQVSGSIPSGLTVEFGGVNSEAGYDSDSDILFVGVRGAVGNSVPSSAQTALWLTTQLNGTRDYNRLIADAATNVSAYRQVGTTNAAINADKIKFVPGEASTQSLGYIEVTGTGPTRTFVSGGATYFVNITADPPQGLSPEALRQVLADEGVTLANMQSISLNIPI